MPTVYGLWLLLLLLLGAPLAHAGAPADPAGAADPAGTEGSDDPEAPDPAALARRAELSAALDAITIKDSGKAFLWKVTSKKKKHKGTAWVFGSVHLGFAEMYPLNAVIDRAFEEAEALVVEADIEAPGVEKETAAKMMEVAMLPAGESLSALVPDEADALKATLARYMVPMAVADRMKPFMISMMLSLLELQWAGWDPAHGIDRHFLERARGNKEIVELESAAMQLQLFADMPMPVQVAMLRSSIDFHGAADRWTRLAWDAIAAGDADSLVRLAEVEGGGGDDPALEVFNQVLLDNRNVGMADLIVKHVTAGEGDWFVVVGALHLPGEDGVLDLIDDRRFLRVEQQVRD